MSKDNAIKQLKALQADIAEQKAKLRPLFEAGLAELFAKHPTVENIEVGINNHEFNDGDPTYFAVHHEDLTVNFSDGSVAESYGEDKKLEAVRKTFAEFFDEFDVDGFYEDIYGDAYEQLTFSCRNGKVKAE